jgi:hypothetical protein
VQTALPGAAGNAAGNPEKDEVVKPVLAQEEEKKAEYQVSRVRDPFQPFAGISPGDAGTGPDALQRLSISRFTS